MSGSPDRRLPRNFHSGRSNMHVLYYGSLSQTESICILCGKLYYTQARMGSLDCAVHPLRFNRENPGNLHGRFHYDCCGNTDESSPGCYAIDHMSSIEELKHVMRVPYIIMTKQKAHSLLDKIKMLSQFEIPHKEDEETEPTIMVNEDQYVIPVESKATLTQNGEYYKFRTCPVNVLKNSPLLIQQENVSRILEKNSNILINVQEKEEELKKHVFEENSYTGSKEEDSSLVHYYQDKNSSTAFVPFYIIRRMDFTMLPQ
jgi:hypothetical protein